MKALRICGLVLTALLVQVSWTAFAACPAVHDDPLRAAPGLLPWALVIAAGLVQLPRASRWPFALGLTAFLTIHDLGLRAWAGHWCPWTEPSWLIARAVALWVAAAIASRVADSWRRAVAPLLALPVAVTLVWAASLVFCLRSARGTREVHADVAVVLGLSLPPDGSCPPGLRSRAERGAALYRSGRVRYVMLTGGPGIAPRSEADAAAEVVRAGGVPAGAVLLERRSGTTRENVFFAEALMRPRGLHTALLVSDPDHLGRAMLHARDAGLTARGEPVVTAEWTNPRTATFWVLRETSMLSRDALLRALGMRRTGRL